MKRTFLFLMLALVTFSTYAQRSEINDAEDANEEGNYEKARKLLKSVESQIPDERESRQADFYLAKGNAYLANKGQGQSAEDLKTAGESFKKAKELGEEEDAMAGMKNLRRSLINSAAKDQKNKNFGPATKKLRAGYDMNKKDTMVLYFAANSALNAEEYDTSLKYFKELNDIGYSGSQLMYTLKNKKSGKVEKFKSKKTRDTYAKSDQYTEPGVERTKSKKAEITKMIALIYNQKGDVQKAKQAIQTARKNNPDDMQLKLVDAEVQQELGNDKKYNDIIQEVAAENPDNAELQYRLGVSAMNDDETEKALKYFNKTTELDPKLRGAFINLAFVTLNQEKALLDKMNNLGMSDEDNAKYEKLKKKRNQIFKDAIPYLKKAIELNPEESGEEIKQLKSLYLQLGQKKKAEELTQKYN